MGSPTPLGATVSLTEAARIIGIDRHAVMRAVERGEFPVVRMNSRRRIPRAFLDRFIQGEWESQLKEAVST